MMVDPSIIEAYTVGKEGFIVALLEAIGVPQIFDRELTSSAGRLPGRLSFFKEY